MKKIQLFPLRSLTIIGILLFSSLINYSQDCKLPDLIPYRKGKKWGYCDSTKKIVIPCKYEMAYPFKENYNLAAYSGWEYATVVEEGRYYRMDEKGKKYSFTTKDETYAIKEETEIKPVDVEANVSPVAAPYVIFEKDNLKGVKDSDGSIVVQPIYDSIMDADRAGNSYYNTFFVKLKGKWGLVGSDKGIPSVHESIKKIYGYLQLGYCVMVKNKNKVDFYTIGNYRLNEVSYDEVRLGEKFIAVRTGNKWGLIEIESFKLVLPVGFDDIDSINSVESLYLVKKSKKNVFIDCNGREYFEN